MRRLGFIGLLVALVVFYPFAQDQARAEQPEGPNLQIPEDFPEKALEMLQQGIATFKQMKSGGGQQQRGYVAPYERFKQSGSKEGDLDDLIDDFLDAAKGAPKSHLPPYYLCILYQWKSDFNGGAEKWVKRARTEGEKAMKNLDGFYEAALELADINMRLKKYDDALQSYDDALSLSNGVLKDSYQLYWGKLNCLMGKGEWTNLKPTWQECLRTKPDMNKGMKDNIEMIFTLLDIQDSWAPHIHETSNYIIHTNVSESFAEETGERFEVAYKFFAKLFGQKPKADKFHVHVFRNKQDFHNLTKAPSFAGGFYHTGLKHLYYPVTQDKAWTDAVAYHEGFHQFVNPITQTIPHWFNEGNAEFFAPSKYIAEGGARMELKVNSMRLKACKQAMRAGTFPHLRDLLYSGGPEFSMGGEVMGRYYATAWSFCYFCWMYENGKYSSLLKGVLKECQRGKIGPEVVDKVFGKVDIDAVDKEWKKYVSSLN
jgi:tetratricopeptide (TPR) repeat protein